MAQFKFFLYLIGCGDRIWRVIYIYCEWPYVCMYVCMYVFGR